MDTVDTSTAYRELVQGLQDDDLDDLDAAVLSGGGSTIVELVLSTETPWEYSRSTWSAVFEPLDEKQRTDLFERLAEREQLSDRLVKLALDNEWFSPKPNTLHIKLLGAILSDGEPSTARRFVEYAPGFSGDVQGHVETYLHNHPDVIDEGFFEVLSTKIGDKERLFASLIWANRGDLIETHLTEHEHLREGLPFQHDWSDLAQTDTNTADAVIEAMTLHEDTWAENLMETLRMTGSNGCLEFIQALLDRMDNPDVTAERFLDAYFECDPYQGRSSFIEAMLGYGADPPKHAGYGQYLAERTTEGDEYERRFRDWIDSDGEIVEGTIRAAFTEGTPRAVQALQEAGVLDPLSTFSALGSMLELDEENDGVAREIGILHVLDDERLQAPSDEPSYFAQVLQNISERPLRSYQPLAQTLYERSAGGPRADEREAIFEAIADIVETTNAHNEWLEPIVGDLIDHNIMPPPEAAKRIEDAADGFEHLFQDRMNRRERRSLNTQT